MIRLSSLQRVALVLLVPLFFSCGKERAPAASPELLAGIPAMPGSFASSTSAGTDAIQAGYQTAARADSVAAWYRRWLVKDGWQITGDLRDARGTVTVHAEKSGRPIWLIIQPLANGIGSMFSVIGAEADSAAARRRAN
jgi:hypothetical protein